MSALKISRSTKIRFVPLGVARGIDMEHRDLKGTSENLNIYLNGALVLCSADDETEYDLALSFK